MAQNTLRNFQIKQKLGSGSYGVIYKVISKSDKSTLVLKQISLSRMSEKAKKNVISSLFQAANEAHIMGKLKHPFIVCYYDSFIQDNNLNILMEFCEGGDLSYFLKQQNKKFLKQEKIWRFFTQICMGLDYIHKNKILHRDIKTLNIFLMKNQMVKIGDLGVAKQLNANDFAHTMVGTPFYLSPELCQQKPYNQKSDIWALGCLLYQLCTFKHPFEATNQASLILKIIRGKYQPIPQFYSKQLRQMIDLCLERDYKRRPTANMILSKANVKKLIQQFQYEKTVDQFNLKKVAQVPLKVQNPPIPKKTQIKIQVQTKVVKKVLDDLPNAKIVQRSQEKKEQIKIIEAKKKDHSNFDNPFTKKRQSQPSLQVKPKVLFGSQNKADFVKALEIGLKDEVIVPIVKKDEVKLKKQIDSSKIPSKIIIQKLVQKIQIKIDQKIPIKPTAIITPNKNIQIIHKVKLQKKIQPKVYEVIKPIEKPINIIKSGGFAQQKRPETGLQRKQSDSGPKIIEKKSIDKIVMKKNSMDSKNSQQKQIISSTKNLKKQSSQKPINNIPSSKKSQPKIYQYPPKSKQPQINQRYAKPNPPKHLSHQDKVHVSSTSRFNDVTKQQEDMVANLPDIVKKQSSDSEDEDKIKSKKQMKFNDIDDKMVLQMYEQMIESQKSETNINKQSQDTQHQDYEIKQSQENSNENDEQFWNHQEEQNNNNDLEIENEYFGDNVEMVNFDRKSECQEMEEDVEEEQKQEQERSQWSFDQQPQLPMLQESQNPLFEQLNPYLFEQAQQTDEKSEQEIMQQKKNHLQIKLKQNMKRQDEINKLMQLKIQQCKSVVTKNFDQILTFFRTKINMQKQYTEQDQKQVQNFLAKRNLTDQRKFQNIYKIMHFQMELDNTRKIIQTICKKLNELENP